MDINFNFFFYVMRGRFTDEETYSIHFSVADKYIVDNFDITGQSTRRWLRKAIDTRQATMLEF